MGESRGEPPPGCRRGQIEDGVEDLPGRRTPAALPVWLGNQGPDQLPLGIGQIGGYFGVSYPFLRPKQGVRFTFHQAQIVQAIGQQRQFPNMP